MDDETCCEICLENFNLSDKVAKILECCQKRSCLKCLKDIHKKNGDKISCPFCRKITNKNPIDLKVDKEMLEAKTICPNCHKGIKSQELKIKIDKKGKIILLCNSCANNIECPSLKDYMQNLVEEMEVFRSAFAGINTKEVFESSINFKINTFLDNFFDYLKKSMAEKLKKKIFTHIDEEYKINLENLSFICSQFEEFQSVYKNIKHLKEKEIRSYDFVGLTSAVDFYINKSDDIKKNGFKLKKIFDSINNNNKLLTFDEKFFKISQFENFIINILNINLEKRSFNSLIKENFYDENNNNNNIGNINLNSALNTGIDFIDSKFMLIRQENEKLKNLLMKKDLEIMKNEKILKSQINLNESENDLKMRKIVFENNNLVKQGFSFPIFGENDKLNFNLLGFGKNANTNTNTNTGANNNTNGNDQPTKNEDEGFQYFMDYINNNNGNNNGNNTNNLTSNYGNNVDTYININPSNTHVNSYFNTAVGGNNNNQTGGSISNTGSSNNVNNINDYNLANIEKSLFDYPNFDS